jgi:dTDP-4-amino-4,6-dideoxygalactose transaminase
MTEPRPIHLFVPVYRVEETLAEIRECLERGWTGLGYKTLAFEDAWRAYTGLPNAHFLNSATAGLHLALRLLKEDGGWQPGDEVITTPLTFVSTNHVILHEGLRPVFADVDAALCLDPESVAARIGPRTRAVCFVGLGGNPGQLAAVAALCRERGLRLILDAAHMAGTRVDGRHVGGEADAAVFSFHAVKNLPTADAGMICFPRADLDREARQWSWLGIDKDTYSRTHAEGSYRWRYQVEHTGFKYHGNSLMAAVGLVALRYLDADNGRRRELCAIYDRELAGRSGVRIVRHPPGSSRHLYQVLVEDRDEVMAAMNRESVYPGVHYADNTQYPMFRYAAGACPRAHAAGERVISLPLHLAMTDEDACRVARVLLACLRAPGR